MGLPESIDTRAEQSNGNVGTAVMLLSQLHQPGKTAHLSMMDFWLEICIRADDGNLAARCWLQQVSLQCLQCHQHTFILSSDIAIKGTEQAPDDELCPELNIQQQTVPF